MIQITFIITLRSTLQWPALHLRQRLSRPGRLVTAGQRGPRDEEKMEKMESRGKRWRVGEQKLLELSRIGHTHTQFVKGHPKL